MPRADLLALTLDDLTALTNRGTVKRAQREIEAKEVTLDLIEGEDGTLHAKWSDGVECFIPGGVVVARSRCTCPATDLCRHVIRTVLAYQARSHDTPSAHEAKAWNPGDITDEEIARHFKPVNITLARTQFQNGLLIEVLKGEKPTARFHDLACTLRFQVPGDVRYVHCDCSEEPPCVHVPLAIWAFRRLAADSNAAIVSTQEKPLPVPTDVLDAIEELLLAGMELGLSGSGDAWRDRLTRLEERCRKASLIWPAELVAELVHLCDQYAKHDAGFNPDGFVERVGELMIRCRAIRSNTGAVPQLLIRGSASDHWTDLASSRFVGLGCSVQPGRRSVTLTSFLQDANSGSMVAISREFPDPPAGSEDKPRDFPQLALTPVVKGANFAQVGSGQLLTQGGKRATNHELVLGRAKAMVNPQNYSWENLRAPVQAETFAEIRERLKLLPPSSLRPRRVAEDFHVCAVAGVENAMFDAATQSVQATLKDSRGDLALLRHPFTSRGREGVEKLLDGLVNTPAHVRFVAGPMRNTANGLCVEPSAVVLEDSARKLIQPWIDRAHDARGVEQMASLLMTVTDPIEAFRRDWLTCVSEVMILGLRRADAGVLRMWQNLLQNAEDLGLERMAAMIRPMVSGLVEKASNLQWSWQPLAKALLESAWMVRFMQEIER